MSARRGSPAGWSDVADHVLPARRRRSPQGNYRLREEPKVLIPRYLRGVIIAVLLVVIVVPIGYMVLMSFTPNEDVALGAISLRVLGLQNYVDMWSAAPLAAGLLHTVIIAGSAAVVSVFVALLAAYPLTRFEFRGRRSYLYTLVALQTVPGTTTVLPLFAILSWIQTTLSVSLIGTYWPIILTYMTFGVPLSTWLLVAYLRTVPRDLEEAGLVDGCSPLGALRRIVLPLALPAMVVALVFAFLVGWNDVLFASVFTNQHTQTLAIVLELFSSTSFSTGTPVYGELMSAAVVSSIPVVVLYLVCQRYLVSGLAVGSLNG